MEPTRDFKQLHTAWRSAVVLAALLRLLTPLQHPAEGAPPFCRYERHGVRPLVTCPHVMAWTIGALTTAMHIRTTHANLRPAITSTQMEQVMRYQIAIFFVLFRSIAYLIASLGELKWWKVWGLYRRGKRWVYR